VTVGGGLLLIADRDELRVVDSGDRARGSDDEDVIGASGLGDIKEAKIQTRDRVVQISEDERQVL